MCKEQNHQYLQKSKVEYTFIGRQLDDEFYRMISTYTNRPPLSNMELYLLLNVVLI